MTLLFAYGSNMDAREMEAFCPGARFAGPARLPGHRLELRRRSIRWGGGAADVVTAPEDEVWGALYELPPDALAALDAKEGRGFAYRRRGALVEQDGRPREALLYEVIDKEPAEVAPAPDYAALLLDAAARRGLPGPYVERLRRRLAVSVPRP